MRKRKPDHADNYHDRETEIIAYLYYRGLKEHNIATLLGCSIGKVGNRLAEARRKRLLVEERHFHRSRMADSDRFVELERLDYSILVGEKLKKENSRFHQFTVLDSGGTGESPQAIDVRLQELAQRLAPLLNSLLLKRSSKIGVSWGTTLGAAIEALRPEPGHSVAKTHHLFFVPICGEPWGAPHREKSSSYLAGQLDQYISHGQGHFLSLAGVPAVIPLRFHNKQGDHKVIRHFFQEATAFGEIFGRESDTSAKSCNQAPMVETLDTILTSVGAVDKPWRMCGRKLCETGGIPEQRFSDLVLGDLAGVLIPRNEATAKASDYQRIEAAWTGIRRCHLEKIAKHASPNGSPGVVVIAIGHNKAKLLHTVIRQGLVNQVFCDEDLAKTMAALCGVQVSAQAVSEYLRKTLAT